jgi:hypothetical protein
MKWTKLFCIISTIINILGCWVMWEAVVRPLRNMIPGGWDKNFPAPFYIFEAPIWFWHDLAITLIITGTIVLAYLAFKD